MFESPRKLRGHPIRSGSTWPNHYNNTAAAAAAAPPPPTTTTTIFFAIERGASVLCTLRAFPAVALSKLGLPDSETCTRQQTG